MDWAQDILSTLQNHPIQKSNLYDSDFYKKHAKYKPIYDFIGDLITGHLKPKSAIDFGCGCGLLLDRLWRHGVCNIFGIEQSPEAKHFWITYLVPEMVQYLFIMNILDFEVRSDTYDLAVCMEVAEHIDKQYSDVLVTKIASSAERFIWWTAAQPGQGGTGHINCQPIEYWTAKFRELTDFIPDWEKTYEVKQVMLQNHAICLAYPWFRDNLVVFRKVRS